MKKNREANWQVDADEEEEVPVTSPSEEDSKKIKQILEI